MYHKNAAFFHVELPHIARSFSQMRIEDDNDSNVELSSDNYRKPDSDNNLEQMFSPVHFSKKLLAEGLPRNLLVLSFSWLELETSVILRLLADIGC